MSYSIYKKTFPRIEYPQPVVSFLADDPTVAKWEAAFSQLANSYQTSSRSKLDVRVHGPWEPSISTVGIPRLLDPTLASWSPAWAQEANSFRTNQGKILDIRLVQDKERIDWDYPVNLTGTPVSESLTYVIPQSYDAGWERVWV